MKAVIISVVCLLSGCAVPPLAIFNIGPEEFHSVLAISKMSSEELRSVDMKALCSAYVYSRSAKEKIRAELRSRDVEIVKDSNVRGGYSVIGTRFTDRDWQAIDARHIFVGMSESALICSWGLPGSCGDITHSSYGPTQYAYQSCDGYSSRFVYVEDNTVVDWSTEQ